MVRVLPCLAGVVVLLTGIPAMADEVAPERSPLYMRLSLGAAYQFATDIDADGTNLHYERMEALAGATSVVVGYGLDESLILQADLFGTLVLPETVFDVWQTSNGLAGFVDEDGNPVPNPNPVADVHPVRFVALGLGATWYPVGGGVWTSLSAGPMFGVVGTGDEHGTTRSLGLGAHVAVGYEWSPWEALGLGLAADYMLAYDEDDLKEVANDMHFDAHAIGLHLTLVPRM